MTIVFLVSRGCYSDYTVLCAAPTKEDADEVAETWNRLDGRDYSQAFVETVRMRTAADIADCCVLTIEQALYSPSAVAADPSLVGLVHHPDEEREIDLHADGKTAEVRRWKTSRGGVHLEVSGTDHERVRKVFGEHKAGILAELEDLADPHPAELTPWERDQKEREARAARIAASPPTTVEELPDDATFFVNSHGVAFTRKPGGPWSEVREDS